MGTCFELSYYLFSFAMDFTILSVLDRVKKKKTKQFKNYPVSYCISGHLVIRKQFAIVSLIIIGA